MRGRSNGGRRTVELKPEDPEGHLVLGHALLGMGRFDEAAQAYHKAHQAGHELHPEAVAMLGATPLLRWLSENQVVAFPATPPPPSVFCIGWGAAAP